MAPSIISTPRAGRSATFRWPLIPRSIASVRLSEHLVEMSDGADGGDAHLTRVELGGAVVLHGGPSGVGGHPASGHPPATGPAKSRRPSPGYNDPNTDNLSSHLRLVESRT